MIPRGDHLPSRGTAICGARLHSRPPDMGDPPGPLRTHAHQRARKPRERLALCGPANRDVLDRWRLRGAAYPERRATYATNVWAWLRTRRLSFRITQGSGGVQSGFPHVSGFAFE